MSTVTALLTNKAYGYPTRGARRRRKPTILACLHQTANATATAIGERTYANRTGSWGPSATAYIDRDGTIVRAIDPVKYAAWSQGDVASPNTKIPTVAAAVASGVNMNEWVHESIECSGSGTEPLTDASPSSSAPASEARSGPQPRRSEPSARRRRSPRPLPRAPPSAIRWVPSMAEINPGDVVRVATTPGFTDTAGTLTDPTLVRLRWRVAGGAETTWVFGTDTQVVKDGVGLYHADIPVVAAGLHYFRWEGAGAVTAAEESTFNVVTSFGGAA